MQNRHQASQEKRRATNGLPVGTIGTRKKAWDYDIDPVMHTAPFSLPWIFGVDF
jgi:hypothetical protein